MDAIQALQKCFDAHSRRGHFIYESGHHGDLWIDLDGMLADGAHFELWTHELAERVRDWAPQVVCGPKTGGAYLAQGVASHLGADFVFTERDAESPAPIYRLPPKLRRVVAGRGVLVVDDAVNAGFAIRATLAEIATAEGIPIGLGCLLALNDPVQVLADSHGLPLAALHRVDSSLWEASQCSVCRTT